MKNLYEILGVEKDATGAQIKAAYKAKAKKLHPDKGGSAEAFAELQTAYDVLGDAARKGARNPEWLSV